jgi:hypothetical protein
MFVKVLGLSLWMGRFWGVRGEKGGMSLEVCGRLFFLDLIFFWGVYCAHFTFGFCPVWLVGLDIGFLWCGYGQC